MTAKLYATKSAEGRRCYSPIACAGFGYCRNLNLDQAECDRLPRGVVPVALTDLSDEKKEG